MIASADGWPENNNGVGLPAQGSAACPLRDGASGATGWQGQATLAPIAYGHRMKQPKKPSRTLSEARDERAERLAAALRENLKRRKAQARAQQPRGGQKSTKD